MQSVKRFRIYTVVFLAVVLGVTIGFSVAQEQAPPPAPKPDDCFQCHDGTLDDMDADMRASLVSAVPVDWKPGGPKANPKRAGLTLKLDREMMKQTGHGDLCLNCHPDVRLPSHPQRLQPVHCNQCHYHDDFDTPYRQSAHWQAAQAGNANAPVCADCHGAHYILSASDAQSPMNRENVASLCGQCHTASVVPGRSGRGAYDRWLTGVHAQKKDGRINATCNDCHDSHGAQYMAGPTAALNISRTCGRCHQQIAEQYELGVHSQALHRGNLSSPTCTDCHGSHDVMEVGNPSSPVYAYQSVAGVCAQCHQAERINNRFGIRGTLDSYQSSFHGLALKKGDLRAADCASCHGAHDILHSSDPRSSIYPDNLQKTCGRCHPGMGAHVKDGKVHPQLARDAGTLGEKVQWWVRWAYLMLIPGVLGFMLVHNLLDWFKKIREHIARQRAAGRYLRLDRTERIQHIVLMSSFSLLALSGFALTFGWKIPGLSGELNETIRAYLHRLAALVMIGWFLFHSSWVITTKRGRGYVLAMIPTLKDGYDIIQTVGYNLGLTRTRPKFERFSYIEKAEYLAMIWGTVVMVLSGFVLWFEEAMLKLMPLWGLNVAHIIHLMEAILATLAIIIWHFYSVLFNPDIAPMATHWLTGTLTEEQMEHEHAAELERLLGEEGQKE